MITHWEPATDTDGKLYAYLIDNKTNSVLQSQAIAVN